MKIGNREILQNPFSIDVELTDEEFGWLLALASERQQPKEGNEHARDKRIIDRDNVKTHHIGLCGEYAVQKLLHIPLDQASYVNGDLLKDFELYGTTIEVKTLKGYLTFVNLSDFKADVAILVLHNDRHPKKLSVQGWTHRNEFAKKHFVDNFGYGDRPCMQPIDLHSMSTLRTYCLTTSNFRWLLSEFKREQPVAIA